MASSALPGNVSGERSFRWAAYLQDTVGLLYADILEINLIIVLFALSPICTACKHTADYRHRQSPSANDRVSTPKVLEVNWKAVWVTGFSKHRIQKTAARDHCLLPTACCNCKGQ